MTNAWLMNAIALYATTVGALLIWAQLLSSPRDAAVFRTPEAQRAYAVQRRQLVIAVGLLCLWLVLQDVAFILM